MLSSLSLSLSLSLCVCVSQCVPRVSVLHPIHISSSLWSEDKQRMTIFHSVTSPTSPPAQRQYTHRQHTYRQTHTIYHYNESNAWDTAPRHQQTTPSRRCHFHFHRQHHHHHQHHHHIIISSSSNSSLIPNTVDTHSGLPRHSVYSSMFTTVWRQPRRRYQSNVVHSDEININNDDIPLTSIYPSFVTVMLADQP